jgi:VWFA-related protein
LFKKENLLISYSSVKYLSLSGFCLAAAILMLPVETSAQRGSPAVPHVRTVHVSAVDRKETPVTDLAATEFVLREGGDVREIIRVEPASTPLHIAIIVDDSGTGIFRVPIANFVNQLLGRAQFAVKHVIGQAVRLVDYTSDVERLRDAILRLGVRAETPDGGRVVEAVFDTAKEVRDFDRPVIVLLTDTHAEYSSLPAHHVLEELQRSGAILHVIAVARLAQLNPSSVPLAKDKPADLLEHQLDINRVLGDGPKQTGGRRVEIGGLGGTIPELQSVAAQLKQQYLITYLVPAGEKLNQRLSVSSKRRGITVRAPSRGARGNP